MAAPGLLVVAIDDKTFDDLGESWPFPRSRHAQAIDRLRRDGAGAIVYDVQFTEQTTPREDNALIDAVGRAAQRRPGHGRDRRARQQQRARRRRASRCASAPAPAPATCRPGRAACCSASTPSAGGPRDARGGRRAPRRPRAGAGAFDDGGAWIDFRGPPGTIDTVSFSDLVHGRVDPALVRGRIVVVGASAATLQDVHPTPTASGRAHVRPRDRGQRDLHGHARAAAARRAALDRPARHPRPRPAAGARQPAPARAAGRAARARRRRRWLVIAQLAFDRGHVLSVAAPLFALALGTVATIAAGYLAERTPPPSLRRAQRGARGGRARAHDRAARDPARDHPAPRPPRPSRATRRPGCTSSASACCASASASRWA